MLPSRKSGIGFDITSCICTIIKKASLGHAIPPGGIDLFRAAKASENGAPQYVFSLEWSNADP